MNRDRNMPTWTAEWPCCAGTEFTDVTRDTAEIQAMHRAYHNAQWRLGRREYPIGSAEEWGKQQPKARCYREFCCNTATNYLHDYGPRQGTDPQYVGVWGWCDQHRHEAFEERRQQARR